MGAKTLKKPTYKFTFKHKWSLKNNLISGITLPAWLKMLYRHGWSIDLYMYWHRVLFITFMSFINWILAAIENYFFAEKIASQTIHSEPVFILGHPRTGTTHLHKLLSLDINFATTTTFQAGFSSSFLILENFQWFLEWLIDKKRPMDNMDLSFSTPAEDEIAVNCLTGGISPYCCLSFMSHFRQLLTYCTFEDASDSDREEWCSKFIYFLKKVSLSSATKAAAVDCTTRTAPKPLLIKSPVHIGRLPILLRLFPGAKFIFIHRDPLTVFQSSAHMADTYCRLFCLFTRLCNRIQHTCSE